MLFLAIVSPDFGFNDPVSPDMDFTGFPDFQFVPMLAVVLFNAVQQVGFPTLAEAFNFEYIWSANIMVFIWWIE